MGVPVRSQRFGVRMRAGNLLRELEAGLREMEDFTVRRVRADQIDYFYSGEDMRFQREGSHRPLPFLRGLVTVEGGEVLLRVQLSANACALLVLCSTMCVGFPLVAVSGLAQDWLGFSTAYRITGTAVAVVAVGVFWAATVRLVRNTLREYRLLTEVLAGCIAAGEKKR
jgi:hypothetical protein